MSTIGRGPRPPRMGSSRRPEPGSKPLEPSTRPDVFEKAPAGAIPPALRTATQLAKPNNTVSLIQARRIATAHDEMLDRKGNVRPHYRSIYPLVRYMSARRKQRALRDSRRAFRGDNALHPIPRILTRSELDTLQRGVVQRGTALRMFLQDHYSGAKSYAKLISPETVDAIIRRNRDHGYCRLLDPAQISFPYGPDVLRGPDGKFYVIEDNTGYIGGPGDLIAAREILFELEPRYQELLEPADDPSEYFRGLVERAKERAIPKDGRVVMYMVPPYPDNEDERLRKIMQSFGVEVVTTRTKNRLVVEDGGVYLSRPGLEPERVGYVFLNGEHKWLDAGHPRTRDAYLLWQADAQLEDQKLGKRARAALELVMTPDPKTQRIDTQKVEATLRQHGLLTGSDIADAITLPGLVDAMLARKVATSYSPGVDFVGDKAFKGYVEDLIRHYLDEEPILRSIPVHSFAKRAENGEMVPDEAAIQRFFADGAYRGYVFKVVDGRGGTGVYIGPKLEPDQVPEIIEKIRARPAGYVAEPFMPLSVLDGHIVDLRLLAAVDAGGVVVSPTPWGRGVPLAGDGKVNLSQRGREFAVVVVDEPKAHSRPANRAPTRPKGRGPRGPARTQRRGT